MVLNNQGMPCAEIARELGVLEGEVIGVLSRNGDSSVDITDEQLVQIRRKLYDLAMYSMDEAVASKTAIFLLERARPVVQAQGPSTIIQINQALQMANETFKKLCESQKT